MKVKNIIIGKQAEEYENCVQFIKLAKNKKINLIVLEAKDKLYFDKNTYIEVFFPDIKNTILENKINNNSLVFKLVYHRFSMLFTGDIEKEAEEILVKLYGNKLQANILKVAHHGSKTSSSIEFIECVKPKIALIGVGKNNNFGHPNIEVLQRLKNIGARIYRTDIDGEISVRVDKRIKWVLNIKNN